MSDQYSMFEVTHGLGGTRITPIVNRNVIIVAKTPQPTSAAAAIKAYPKTGTKRAQVFNAIRLFNGLTDEEIENTLTMSGNTVRPTRVSLVRDGLVMDSGQTRPTKSGNEAIVWMVV
jgi:hypothetical protein